MSPKKKSPEQKEEKKVKRTKLAKIPSRDERAAAFKTQFNSDMQGRATLLSANEYTLPFMYRRLPTGLLSLDVALKGGFPGGGINQIKGPKNAGKTWVICQMIRQLQYYLGDKTKVLLAMVEMLFDRSQARTAGVEIDIGEENLRRENEGRIANGLPPFTPQEAAVLRNQIGTIDEVHAMSAEDLFEGILGAVDSNVYHLIAIDSFGAILTAAQVEQEMAEKSYGGASGPITQFLKKLAGLLTFKDEFGLVREVCLMGINQVRDNLQDANRGWRTTGGRMLEHSLFTDLLLLPGGMKGGEVSIYGPEGTKKKWVNTHKEVNWMIEKGKAGMHEGDKGTFVYDFRINNANFYLDTLVTGVQKGVITNTGNGWLGIPHPNGKPDEYLLRVHGQDNFVQALAQDAAEKAAAGDPDSFMNYIRSVVFRNENIHIKYDWEEPK